MDVDTERTAWAGDVLAALDRLTPMQGAVVRLAYFQQLSPERIAERLSISVRQVRTDLAAGLDVLGRLLAGSAASA